MITLLKYRFTTGSVAWIIHRVTGIGLTLYIFAHLFVLSNLRDRDKFEALMELTHSPLVRLMEVGLIGMVAAHALNGLRLTILDLGAPTRLHKPMFYTLSLVWALLMAAGALYMLGGGAA